MATHTPVKMGGHQMNNFLLLLLARLWQRRCQSTRRSNGYGYGDTEGGLVAALEWPFSVIEGQLRNNGYRGKYFVVLVAVVAESLLQTAPLFESTIDRLVPSKSPLFCSRIGP
jgi:hypothetical protein